MMISAKILNFLLIFLICPLNKSNAQEGFITRSIVGMTELLKLENILISQMTNYVKHMEKKIQIMEKILEDLVHEHGKAEINAEAYLGNPLKSFKLIRRLHNDWVHFEVYMRDEVPDLYSTLSEHMSVIPNEYDLREAVNSIQRLQSAYNLRVEDMANGLINGVQYNSNFSVQDTFTIGHELFKNNKFLQAIPWLNLSFEIPFDRKLYEEVFLMEEKEMHTIYIKTLLIENRFTDALDAIKYALRFYPEESEFFDLLQDLHSTKKECIAEDVLEERKRMAFESEFDEPLCLGWKNQKKPILNCYLLTDTNAFTKLAPFKAEILSYSPFIALFYDVINDREIAEFKRISVPILENACPKTENDDLTVATRIAKVASIENDATTTVEQFNQRLVDMTGFDLKDSERLQIVNYGLGGHYRTHFDASKIPNDLNDKALDRRAAVTIYLSDVEQGGHTVFPFLNITVKPTKGQALFWYNINNKGFYNTDTKQTACPVLVGSKWILTKWIRESDKFQLGIGGNKLFQLNLNSN